MTTEGFLAQAFVYLGAAVVSVPVAKRLGLGSVLGYLLAGVIIGPFALGLVGEEGEDVMHFAEFGVVMMLFLIGLELRPAVLWKMRMPILGMGGGQVLATGSLFTGIGILAGLEWQVALAVGFILALSSTAIALQTLNERSMLNTEAGQSGFAVLLFQDIAVIPMLALLPLLAQDSGGGFEMDLSQTALVIGVIAAIILGGRFLLRPVFRFIARTNLREIFTAAALLLVIGVALAMQAIGLSAALGTFLAGVVLAESEYRHELESDIEPFKGLLLGVFFIAVGASIDFGLLTEETITVLAITAGLVLLKLALLLPLARIFRLRPCSGYTFAFLLAQGGEFAFVLLAYATEQNVVDDELASLLILAVTLSMLLTPVLLLIDTWLIQPRFRKQGHEREADTIDDGETPVIVAGYGRFGQVVSRLLHANGFATTLLDHDDSQIELVRQFGYKVYYGDATRMDLLDAAGAAEARLLVIAIDNPEQVVSMVDQVKKHFPHLRILARARNRSHAYQLLNRDVDVVQRETFEAAIAMGESALRLLGFRNFRAHRSALLFRHHDVETLHEMRAMWDEDQGRYIDEAPHKAAERREQLQALIQQDQAAIQDLQDAGWERKAEDQPDVSKGQD